MAKLIRFPTEKVKCPIGKLAHHPRYGVCGVVGAEGFSRVLDYGWATVTVDVRELREVNPVRDLGL